MSRGICNLSEMSLCNTDVISEVWWQSKGKCRYYQRICWSPPHINNMHAHDQLYTKKKKKRMVLLEYYKNITIYENNSAGIKWGEVPIITKMNLYFFRKYQLGKETKVSICLSLQSCTIIISLILQNFWFVVISSASKINVLQCSCTDCYCARQLFTRASQPCLLSLSNNLSIFGTA